MAKEKWYDIYLEGRWLDRRTGASREDVEEEIRTEYPLNSFKVRRVQR